MSLSSVAVRAGELSRPFGAYLELTYSCNWRCVFCYNPRHHDVRRLDVTEWISVLDSLRAIGVLQLTLTGGEPLAHPEFFEIAESARERAFAIRVFTNGAMADSPETVRRLAALQPYCVEISLHGATADVHDTTTMRPGSFAQMWRAVDRLVEANVRLNLKAPVTSINEHQLDAMIELAASRGLPLRLDASLTPRDDGDLAPQRFSASGKVKTRILELGVNTGSVREVTRNMGDSNCGIGRSSLAIDPEGNVYPCMQWRHTSLGNVRREPLDALWQSSHERVRVAKLAIDVNDRLRQERPESSALPFCPALAAQRTGDPLALDDEYRDASLSLISLLRERNAAR